MDVDNSAMHCNELRGDCWRRRGETYRTGLHVALDKTSWKVSTKVSHVLEETVGEDEGGMKEEGCRGRRGAEGRGG